MFPLLYIFNILYTNKYILVNSFLFIYYLIDRIALFIKRSIL